MEPRSVHARRFLSGRARRAAGPQGADGAGARAIILCRRSRARDIMGHGRRRMGIGRARRRCGAAAVGRRGRTERHAAPMSKPKAFIAWSSGKDSAWALHEVRRAGDYDVVGALTTVTETFARVSVHGVREASLRGGHKAISLPSEKVPIPYQCPNKIYQDRTW